MNNGFLVAIVFSLFLSPAFSQNQEDMVLIPTNGAEKSFYIDIFETTNEQGAAKGLISDWGSQKYKPARFENDEAEEYCKKIGKELPTMKEWLRAASLNGKNKNYTLKDDSLTNHINNETVNFGHGSQSISPYEFEQMGIDISGTVGMTGNRPEWVINSATGSYCKCGRGYGDSDETDALIANTCDCPGSGDATARCVFRKQNNVSYSKNVYGELKKYLDLLASGSGTSTPIIEPDPETKIEFDNLDIDDDESDFD